MAESLKGLREQSNRERYGWYAEKFPLSNKFCDKTGVMTVRAPPDLVDAALTIFYPMFSDPSTGYEGYEFTLAPEHSDEGQRKATIEFNPGGTQSIHKKDFKPVKELMLWGKEKVEGMTGIELVFVRAHALRQESSAHAVFCEHRVCLLVSPTRLAARGIPPPLLMCRTLSILQSTLTTSFRS